MLFDEAEPSLYVHAKCITNQCLNKSESCIYVLANIDACTFEMDTGKYVQGGPQNDFLRVDNFATVRGRKAYDVKSFQTLSRKSIKLGKVKGKVFPYSLPSVGPGADPGVQAVRYSLSL